MSWAVGRGPWAEKWFPWNEILGKRIWKEKWKIAPIIIFVWKWVLEYFSAWLITHLWTNSFRLFKPRNKAFYMNFVMFFRLNFSFQRQMNTFQKSKDWISDLSPLRRHFAYTIFTVWLWWMVERFNSLLVTLYDLHSWTPNTDILV